MIAGLLAAGPCGINSSLNAMSSTFVGDFYKTRRPGRDEKHYLSVGRTSTIVAGIIVGTFASACIFVYDPENNKIIDFVLGIMSFAYAGLIGVFATALFTKRGSPRSCIAAIITGFLAVTFMQPLVLRLMGELLEALGVHADWWPTKLKIAFPWQLLIGSLLAFAVCFFGGKNASPDPVDQPK
jgi:Na+/proline symporter